MAQEIKVKDQAGNIATVNSDDVSTKALIAAGILTVVHEPRIEPTRVSVWKKTLSSGAALTINCGSCHSITNFDGAPSLLPALDKQLCIHVDRAEWATAVERYRAAYNGKGNLMDTDFYKAQHSQKQPDPPQHPLAGEWLGAAQ